MKACVIALISLSVTIAGCTTGSKVMPTSGGAYTITKSGTTGFTPLGVLRKEAYEDANEFADSKGMVAEVLSLNEVPAGFARWPQVDLRFRLVRAGDRESGGKLSSVTIRSEAGHDAMGNRTAGEVTATKEIDLYSELKKLAELKERGVLTEDEFQREKKRLLDARHK